MIASIFTSQNSFSNFSISIVKVSEDTGLCSSEDNAMARILTIKFS